MSHRRSAEAASPSLFEEDAPPENLLAGRRALDGLVGVTLLEDYRWYDLPVGGAWVLRSRLSPEIKPEGPIPAATDWYVLVDPNYPWGPIRFYPAESEGIIQTFQHQNRNEPGDGSTPWRTGALRLAKNWCFPESPLSCLSTYRR